MNFNEKPTTLLGDYGEAIVTEYLDKKGLVLMSNINNDKPHPFDLLISNRNNGDWMLSMADVKTKPKLIIYNGTGIDINHYNTYKFLQEVYNMNFFIYFVDYDLGKCYGNTIDNLNIKHTENDKEYPFEILGENNERLIIFHMDNMIEQFILTEEQIKRLKELSPKKYTPEEGLKRIKELAQERIKLN
jgi:hypothetical protein